MRPVSTRIRPSGLIVFDLEQGDELVSVAQVGEAKDVVMVTEQGQAIKFPVTGLTPRSRTAGGVRGIRLLNKDEVVAMSTVTPNSHLLIVSQGGYGKSTPLASYPRHSRGGQGVRTFRTTDKAGKVAAARVVSDGPGQLILIISAKAQVVRASHCSRSMRPTEESAGHPSRKVERRSRRPQSFECWAFGRVACRSLMAGPAPFCRACCPSVPRCAPFSVEDDDLLGGW